MVIDFTKMEGLGNDYIYINSINKNYEKIINNIPKLCNRNFGIGSDGVILILESNIADFKMKMFNSDGTEANMCGNGIRCVGKFLYDKKITQKHNLEIETLSGIKKLKLYVKNEKVIQVEVDMGKPYLNPSEIPVISDNNEVKIKIDNEEMSLFCISMGNPHAIAIVDNVANVNIEKYGSLIENNKIFPERTNVEFIEIIDDENIKMRVWERGAKETLACGTGACASTVMCNIKGYTKENIKVHLLGGSLNIKWNKDNNHIYMTGPATTVYEGKIIM